MSRIWRQIKYIGARVNSDIDLKITRFKMSEYVGNQPSNQKLLFSELLVQNIFLSLEARDN